MCVSALRDTTIYGFDSFEGLQQDWKGHMSKAGHFSLAGQLPKVEDNVKLIKEWFDQTVPVFMAQQRENFSFMDVHAGRIRSVALRDKIIQAHGDGSDLAFFSMR